MSDSIHSDLRRDTLLENFTLLRERACEALPNRQEAQEFANVLARCAERLGLSPRKPSAE